MPRFFVDAPGWFRRDLGAASRSMEHDTMGLKGRVSSGASCASGRTRPVPALTCG